MPTQLKDLSFFLKISGKVIKNSDVISIKRENEKVILTHVNNTKSVYDKVILAMHAPDALSLLSDASGEEKEILGAFKYKENKAVLHTDKNALYPNKDIYAAWNYKTTNKSKDVTLSYWINRLQNLVCSKEYFVSLNETDEIKEVIENIKYSHPQFDLEAIKMQTRRDEINGVNNTYFAGAYWRYGFHEDGLWSANTIAKKLGCEL